MTAKRLRAPREQTDHKVARRIIAAEIARREREAYWRGLLVGVALGIPATAGATYLLTGVSLLAWWL